MEKRLEESPISIFPNSCGEERGVKLRSALMATWSEREGVSWILQFEREGDRDGSEKVISIMEELL